MLSVRAVYVLRSLHIPVLYVLLTKALRIWRRFRLGQNRMARRKNLPMYIGSTFDVTAQDVCTHGYARKVRDVPEEMKREVYREYGITSHGPGDYEIDHLISLELGGSNSIKNLWPESHRTSPWNAQVKDRLEDKLHELVCSGQLDLKTAQQAIASNWIEAYKKYVSPNPPVPEPTSRGVPEAADRTSQVWVNTRSGKYWKRYNRKLWMRS